MTAKEYLQQARNLKRKIEYRQNQIIQLQAMAGRATGSAEALRVSGTHSRSKVEDAIVKIDGIAEKLARDMAEYAEKYREISGVIEAVENPVYVELLTLRYLNFMPWEEIAVKMHYSYHHLTHRFHPRALQCVSVPVERCT